MTTQLVRRDSLRGKIAFTLLHRLSITTVLATAAWLRLVGIPRAGSFLHPVNWELGTITLMLFAAGVGMAVLVLSRIKMVTDLFS